MKTPSRVMPVITASRGCIGRVYQKVAIYKPRSVDLIISSMLLSPGNMNKLRGKDVSNPKPGGDAWPVDDLFSLCAEYMSYTGEPITPFVTTSTRCFGTPSKSNGIGLPAGSSPSSQIETSGLTACCPMRSFIHERPS